MKGIFTALVVLFCVSITGAHAQTRVTIQGSVVEAESNAPIAGASIRITSADSSVVTGTYSDTRGRFKLTGIPEGSYTVMVTSVGYQTTSMSNVDVNASMEALSVVMDAEIVQKGVTVVTASRVEQKALEAPAAVTVVEQRVILERPAQTPVEYLEGTAGVDQAPTGISQRNVNVRGFNNVFTGTLDDTDGLPACRGTVSARQHSVLRADHQRRHPTH